MDKATLIKWKSELEVNLAELERRISELESERRKIMGQLGAVATLLSTTEGGEMASQESSGVILTEADAITGFLSSLKGQGWSIFPTGKRSNIYVANRKGKSVNLWVKFSRYYETVDKYWFGIGPENLKSMTNEIGGVILLLGAPDNYLCFTFAQLQQLLLGATKARTGQKLHIRGHKEQAWLLPVGTAEWIEVSRFYGTEGLREIGLED